jgi:hypothetical protein
MGKAEAVVEKYLVKQVHARGGLCEKWTSGRNGIPDRIVLLNGHIVLIELKALDGSPSAGQRSMMNKLVDQGADVRLVFTRAAVDKVLDDLMATAGPMTTSATSHCRPHAYIPGKPTKKKPWKPQTTAWTPRTTTTPTTSTGH